MLGMLHLEVEADKVSKSLGTWIVPGQTTTQKTQKTNTFREGGESSGVLGCKTHLRMGRLERRKPSSRDRLSWRLPLVAWPRPRLHPDGQTNSEYLNLELVPRRAVIDQVWWDMTRMIRCMLKASFWCILANLCQSACAESFAALFLRLQTIGSDTGFLGSSAGRWTGCRGAAQSVRVTVHQLYSLFMFI